MRLDPALACALALLAALLALPGAAVSLGPAWDEPAYVEAARSYVDWLSSPSLSTLDQHWERNHEHPPLHKAAAGLSFVLSSQLLGWAAPLTGFRLGTLPFLFLLVFSVYWLGLRLFGRLEAVLACVLLLGLPKIFFHAQLLSLDLSATALYAFVAAMAWRRHADLSPRWQLGAAAALAFLTKLAALPALALLPALGLLRWWREKKVPALPALFLAWIPAALVCAALIYAGWPWLWPAPLARFQDYFLFHLRHYPMPTLYFGEYYDTPPWHYPLAHLALTTPLLVLLAALAGLPVVARRCAREGARAKLLFLTLAASLPLALLVFGAHRFDGVRLFLPAFPFLMLFAAAAIAALLRKLPSAKLVAFHCLLLALYLLAQLWPLYPYNDSYFNELAGGLKGAERRGFDIHLWCEAIHEVKPALKGKVWAPVCSHLLGDGQEARRWRLVDQREQADLWVVVNREGMVGPFVYQELESRKRVAGVERHGVELVGVYENAASR